MSKPPAQPIQGLIDGLAVLQELAAGAEPVSGKELADRLGLEATRTNRLLKTLAYLGIAYQTAERRYASGPGMHVLAAQSLFASGLVQRALGPLEELTKLQMVVAMGVLWRDRVSYLYFWRPGATTAESLGRAALHPATQSSIGMALLAAKPDAEIRAIFRLRKIARFPGGAGELLEEIRETRRRGFAVVPSGEGKTVGVTFGSPPYAAIAVSGKMTRSGVEECVAAMRRTVAAIEGVAGDRQKRRA
jgi:DNA-binding IclR family transcriptional regulator